MVFAHMLKAQLPFILFRVLFNDTAEFTLCYGLHDCSLPYPGYFIHSLSTLHFCNAPSLATRLTGNYRDRTYTGKCGPALLDTQHKKRTKAAKRIKALLNYPIKKLYPELSDYASEYWELSYHPEHKAYGFYYNPDAFFDWYSIGGRWPDLFLVKEGCKECSIGERSQRYGKENLPGPEGYKWVCAARKKDIEWQ